MKNKTIATSIFFLAGILAGAHAEAADTAPTTTNVQINSTATDAATAKVANKTAAKAKKKKKKVDDSSEAASQSPTLNADKAPEAKPNPPAVATPADATSPTATGAQNPAAPAATEEEANNRAKTLEGSQSPLSIQGNISYSGSSIKHPFSSHAPNPTDRPQAPPVQLGGTLSGRYRLDKATTVGLGTGFQVDKPFQDPQNFNVSDPNADIAHSFAWGRIHNRVDFLVNLYTDHLYHSAGYRSGYSLSNDGAIHWASGFTLGLVLEVDANSFGGAKDQGSQVLYDLVTDPYVEYQLTKRLNLRSVVGIIHDNIREGDFFTYKRERIYETVGLGIQAMDSLFLYTFVEFTPFSRFTANNSIVGFNAIVNLF